MGDSEFSRAWDQRQIMYIIMIMIQKNPNVALIPPPSPWGAAVFFSQKKRLVVLNQVSLSAFSQKIRKSWDRGEKAGTEEKKSGQTDTCMDGAENIGPRKKLGDNK